MQKALLQAAVRAVAITASVFLATDIRAQDIRMTFTSNGEFFGEADFRLFTEAMPESVENFLGYLERYAGTFIHRNPREADTGSTDPAVDGLDLGGRPGAGFVVQGGGFFFDGPHTVDRIQNDAPIDDERLEDGSVISNLRGTLTNAKAGPNTATGQWFVNLGDNSGLDSAARPDGGFGAFGQILGDGLDVFDAIDNLQKNDFDGSVETLFNDVPVTDFSNRNASVIVLESVVILPADSQLVGDANRDGVVDEADFDRINADFGGAETADSDLNADGFIDGEDLAIWREAFNATLPLSQPVIQNPEPTAGVLAVLSLLAAATRRRA